MFFCQFTLLVLACFPWCLLANSLARTHPIRHYEYLHPVVRILKGSKNTLEQDSHFQLTVNAFNTTMHLSLAPNPHILHPTFAAENKHLLVYSGLVYDDKSTLVAGLPDSDLSQKNELGTATFLVHKFKGGLVFDGVLTFEDITYTIKPIPNSSVYYLPQIPSARLRRRQDKEATSIIYRSHEHPLTKEGVRGPSRTRVKRSSLNFLRRRDDTCEAGVDSIYMAVAADCSYVEHYGSVDEAKTEIISDWLKVSDVYYKSFGVKLGIFDIYAPHESCLNEAYKDMKWNGPCNISHSLTARLDTFAKWALESHLPNALWHLRTNCSTTGNIGFAYKPTDCSSVKAFPDGTFGNMAVAVSSVYKESWKLIAHEIGHNFNATHDCGAKTTSQSNCCKCDNCNTGHLMSAESSDRSAEFSKCSERQICKGITKLGNCFKPDPSPPFITLNQCGNGIKEAGEECDCGDDKVCIESGCCNTETCTFNEGSECVDGKDKCCQSCRLKPAGEVCRQSRGECDIEEKCDGTRATCPKDLFQPNGMSCSNNNFCGNGQCTSRDLQCRAFSGFHHTVSTDKACDKVENLCSIHCAISPTKCILFPGSFIDGTKCGYNLFCKSGSCEGGWMDKAADRILRNLTAAILIGAGFGIFLIALIYCIIRRVFRKAPAEDVTSFPAAPPIHSPSDGFPVLRPRPSLRTAPNQFRPDSSTPLVTQEDEDEYF
ncbi:hypothetical protein DSO57_1010991 [Entomophthora muscae]|uniref:Uncharacterized protein n=1 Tax=Entomophthora muscae TaxID=34485 RepID=A0ACC2UT06_9FUNG|nr:hypothetical protein DSO57_1010991 [Entomophthora muscae]